MSDFDEKVVDRIKRLEREVERLRVKESPGAWLAWTPTVTGWAAAGYICIARYCKVGKMVSVKIRITGTSDSASVYVTLPFTSVSNGVNAWAYAMDNGTATATPAYVVLDTTSKIKVYLNATGTPWTASGSKRVFTTFTYEAE